MNIRSLGRKTDLIFARFSGTVEDKGFYTLVKTPSNPGYHWGNYIIFDRPPQGGDLKNWKKLFNSEFTYYSEPHHYTFTWDCDNNHCNDVQEFIDNGFELDSGVVLTTSTLNSPPYPNNDIFIKKIESDEEWSDVLKLQMLCSNPKYINDYYEAFKTEQMKQYRKMSEDGLGNWFGAYLGEKLVGDLGIFYENDIGRYQNVGTHPEYRKKGICGTLVYEAGNIAFRDYDVNYLVIEADPEYHAARIYESVGFKKSETNYSLSWWRGKELS